MFCYGLFVVKMTLRRIKNVSIYTILQMAIHLHNLPKYDIIKKSMRVAPQ